MNETTNAPATETAIFAAGCFWGVESDFRAVPGVIDAAVGYIGGITERPAYRDVCSGTTNHAEAVRVVFDPQRVTYETLVRAFFAMHDPTTMNKQGPDVGTQYRSAVFTTTPEQHEHAAAILAQEAASGRHRRPIITTISEAPTFWPAEEYHQRYFEKQSIVAHR